VLFFAFHPVKLFLINERRVIRVQHRDLQLQRAMKELEAAVMERKPGIARRMIHELVRLLLLALCKSDEFSAATIQCNRAIIKESMTIDGGNRDVE
jgi:hypothetical protein